eukprot:5372735-Amphidinium_carterae.1
MLVSGENRQNLCNSNFTCTRIRLRSHPRLETLRFTDPSDQASKEVHNKTQARARTCAHTIAHAREENYPKDR